MRYAFAGNKEISLSILRFLIKKDQKPLALLLNKSMGESFIEELKKLSGLEDRFIFYGKDFRSKKNIELLNVLDLDYIIGIHFPYIIPPEILEIPKVGVLNLHPAYLPYNKGWHTPSWAILDGTPYGATLHFMSEALDEGDIIYQKKLKVESSDTAHSLYQKILKLEEEVFYNAFNDIISLTPDRVKQEGEGTTHFKKELKGLQELNLEEVMPVKELLNRLRALTTNDINEAAYFKEDGKKVAIQINFVELNA